MDKLIKRKSKHFEPRGKSTILKKHEGLINQIDINNVQTQPSTEAVSKVPGGGI